ncbi:hypothetical protein JCM10212_004813 [Sporobolomyces blumeae]
MFAFVPLALAASALFSTTASALPASVAPKCAVLCFEKKIDEADYLAPGVGRDNLRGLCETTTFVAAYNTCLEDNDRCSGELVFDSGCSVRLADDVGIDCFGDDNLDQLDAEHFAHIGTTSSAAPSAILSAGGVVALALSVALCV